MAGQMVHVEFPAGDTAKAREFWGELFGWEFQAFEGSPTEYLMTRFSENQGGAIFADDGELKPATLLKTDGAVAGRPVVSARTARAVRHMLELATQPGGTAPQAQVAGYRVAGKTGTARKIEGREYTRKYVASFVGMAPASNPRLIMAVMIDEPTGGDYYGGSVAGPVFSNVMGSALRMLNVPTDAPVDNVVLPPPGSRIEEET